MTYSRDPHHIVYHYADGVADILGLSTAQQLAIRTAMHLALREQAAGYDATVADMATQIEQLRNELQEAVISQEQAASQQLTPLLATVSAGISAATISTNGKHAVEHLRPIVAQAPETTFIASAAYEAADQEAQPDPTPAPTKPGANDRKPFNFSWGMLDDTSLAIARNLDDGRAAWRVVNADDKRVITLAVIKELQLDLPPGETLAIVQFDNRRPIWMPSFPSLSTSLGMTWKQMLAAAAD